MKQTDPVPRPAPAPHPGSSELRRHHQFGNQENESLFFIFYFWPFMKEKSGRLA